MGAELDTSETGTISSDNSVALNGIGPGQGKSTKEWLEEKDIIKLKETNHNARK